MTHKVVPFTLPAGYVDWPYELPLKQGHFREIKRATINNFVGDTGNYAGVASDDLEKMAILWYFSEPPKASRIHPSPVAQKSSETDLKEGLLGSSSYRRLGRHQRERREILLVKKDKGSAWFIAFSAEMTLPSMDYFPSIPLARNSSLPS